MNIDIRKSVMDNLKSSSEEEVRSTITDAMNIKEEKVLPGLGVMFEALWKSSSEEEKEKIVSTITKSFN